MLHFFTHWTHNSDKGNFILATIALWGSLIFWYKNLALSWTRSRSALNGSLWILEEEVIWVPSLPSPLPPEIRWFWRNIVLRFMKWPVIVEHCPEWTVWYAMVRGRQFLDVCAGGFFKVDTPVWPTTLWLYSSKLQNHTSLVHTCHSGPILQFKDCLFIQTHCG